MTFDTTLHIGELLVISSAGFGVLKGGMAIRDAVRDLTTMVSGMRDNLKDHETRLRMLEKGERREYDRRHAEA